MNLTISIHTIEKTLYEGTADAIQLPGTDGELGVLAMHQPLISSLKRGTIRLHSVKGGETTQIPINGGFVEIQPESKVVVLADAGSF